MRTLEEKRNDPRPTNELIDIARFTYRIADEEPYEENPYWDAISALRWRSTKEVYEAAVDLIKSDDYKDRAIGAVVLGQLGFNLDYVYPFKDESMHALVELLAHEKEIRVLCSIAFAIGHLSGEQGIEPLSRLKNHPSDKVRYAVAHGLCGQADPLAIKTLIELSNDVIDEIRDWATFGLAKQTRRNTKMIRDALAARLTDEDEYTRLEAVAGLAQRKDMRAFDVVLRRLESYKDVKDLKEEEGSCMIDAAADLADERFLPLLIKFKEEWRYEDEWLDRAIKKCKKQSISAKSTAKQTERTTLTAPKRR